MQALREPISPEPPTPLRRAGGNVANVPPPGWCQRCLRAFCKSHQVAAVWAAGCDHSQKKCPRCTRVRHACVPCPPNCYRAANELLELVEAEVEALEAGDVLGPVALERITGLASALDSQMLRSTGDVRQALPGIGAAPGTPSRRSAAAAAPAGASLGSVQETLQLVLQAVRTLAEVQAQRANLSLPPWPERSQLAYAAAAPAQQQQAAPAQQPQAARPRPAQQEQTASPRPAGEEQDPLIPEELRQQLIRWQRAQEHLYGRARPAGEEQRVEHGWGVVGREEEEEEEGEEREEGEGEEGEEGDAVMRGGDEE